MSLIEKHNEKITTLSPEQRETFEERAAIKEHDGNMSRLQAEIEALRETINDRTQTF